METPFISIQEQMICGQVVTIVKQDVKDRCEIKDIRKGEVTQHSKDAAKYHARKFSQGMIPVHPINLDTYHMRTES
jgi:ribosomal protein S1